MKYMLCKLASRDPFFYKDIRQNSSWEITLIWETTSNYHYLGYYNELELSPIISSGLQEAGKISIVTPY